MVDDTLNFLSDHLHVLEQLVDMVQDLHFGRSVAEAFVCVAIEADHCLKRVFPVLTVHFIANKLGGFLVDAHLSLDDHVVN